MQLDPHENNNDTKFVRILYEFRTVYYLVKLKNDKVDNNKASVETLTEIRLVQMELFPLFV